MQRTHISAHVQGCLALIKWRSHSLRLLWIELDSGLASSHVRACRSRRIRAVASIAKELIAQPIEEPVLIGSRALELAAIAMVAKPSRLLCAKRIGRGKVRRDRRRREQARRGGDPTEEFLEPP